MFALIGATMELGLSHVRLAANSFEVDQSYRLKQHTRPYQNVSLGNVSKGKGFLFLCILS